MFTVRRRAFQIAGLAATICSLLAGAQLTSMDPVVQGKPLSAWLDDLSTDRGRDQAKFDAALGAVREAGTNGLSLLIQRLQFKDAKDPALTIARRAQARLAFEALGPEAKPAIPRLIALLKDETFVRGADTAPNAAAALRAIGPDAVAVLSTTIAKGNTSERYGAALALGAFPSSPETVVPPLIAAMKDFDTRIRTRAATSLGQIPGADDKVIPALTAALTDASSPVRFAAVAALRECGTAAKSAITPLVNVIVKDPEEANRIAAVQSLLAIGPNEAATALTGLLARPQTFAPAARALMRFGFRAEPAIPALIRAFKSPDFENIAAANYALRGIGPKGLAALIQNLADPNAQVQLRTIRAIALFGADATAAIPALTEAAKSSDPDVQEAAMSLLVDLAALATPP